MPAASLSTLLRDTKKSFFLRKDDFLIFILIGTIVFGLTSGAMEMKRGMIHKELAQELGLDEKAAENLYDQHQRSWMREDKSDPLLAALQQKGIDPAIYLMQLEQRRMAGEGILGLATLLLSIIVGPWIYASYILLAINHKKSWKATGREAWKKVLTVLGIGILNGLIFLGALIPASLFFLIHPILGALGLLAWFLFLGILAPRLYLAPIIAVIENKKAMAAWKMTYKATNRYWGKIVGNCIVFSLLAFLVLIVSMIVLGIVNAIFSSIAPLLGLIVFSLCLTFVHQCIMAYSLTFATKLTETILAHPRKS